MLQLGGGCWITVALASAVILELADIVAMLLRTEECTVELHCMYTTPYLLLHWKSLSLAAPSSAQQWKFAFSKWL